MLHFSLIISLATTGVLLATTIIMFKDKQQKSGMNLSYTQKIIP